MFKFSKRFAFGQVATLVFATPGTPMRTTASLVVDRRAGIHQSITGIKVKVIATSPRVLWSEGVALWRIQLAAINFELRASECAEPPQA